MDLTLTRDHQSRLDFVEGLKAFVAEQVVPSLRREFDGWAKDQDPAVLRDRKKLLARFERDPLYQASRGLQRLSQEAMWREVAAGLEARRGELDKALDAPVGKAGGSLELAPDMALPRYYTSNDFHIMPGNYQGRELAGPIYEAGVATYTLHRYGKAGDEMGRSLITVLPEHPYRRILYMGCGPGYKAYPLVDRFPDAEMHGIDLSAPMLRYAHARAEANGKRMHFAQMNSEEMRYPDGKFDLVFCMLLLHEIPRAAIDRTIAEAYRVLAPGGVLANLELPHYDSLDPFSAFLMDWDTLHNGEPFWRAYHEMDLDQAYRDAGFAEVKTVESYSEWGGAKGSYMGRFAYHVTMGRKP